MVRLEIGVGVGEAPQPQDHRQPNEVVTFVLPLSVRFNCDDFNSGPLGGNPLIKLTIVQIKSRVKSPEIISGGNLFKILV